MYLPQRKNRIVIVMRSTQSCRFVGRYFPWDRQDCELELGSWTYDSGSLALSKYGDGGDIRYYCTNTSLRSQSMRQTDEHNAFGIELYVMNQRILLELFYEFAECLLCLIGAVCFWRTVNGV